MSLRDYLPKKWLQVGTKYTEVIIVAFFGNDKHKHVRKHEKAAVAEFMMDFSTNRLEIFQELSATEKSLCLTNISLLCKKYLNLSWLKTLLTHSQVAVQQQDRPRSFALGFPFRAHVLSDFLQLSI